MSADILEASNRFGKQPAVADDDGPHLEGACKCLACAHEWHGVAPVGVFGFECPACGLLRGAYVANVRRRTLHWQCNCGSILFAINDQTTYCVSCGAEQRF
jgi:predicted RNA-binding Zn-ribbon protein involved in translation (DUF1610 family)